MALSNYRLTNTLSTNSSVRGTSRGGTTMSASGAGVAQPVSQPPPIAVVPQATSYWGTPYTQGTGYYAQNPDEMPVQPTGSVVPEGNQDPKTAAIPSNATSTTPQPRATEGVQGGAGGGLPTSPAQTVSPENSTEWMSDPRLQNYNLKPGMNNFRAPGYIPPDRVQAIFDAGGQIMVEYNGEMLPIGPGERLLPGATYQILMPGGGVGPTGAPPPAVENAPGQGFYSLQDPNHRATIAYGAQGQWQDMPGFNGFQLMTGPDGTPQFQTWQGNAVDPNHPRYAEMMAAYNQTVSGGPGQQQGQRGAGGTRWDPAQGRWVDGQSYNAGGYYEWVDRPGVENDGWEHNVGGGYNQGVRAEMDRQRATGSGNPEGLEFITDAGQAPGMLAGPSYGNGPLRSEGYNRNLDYGVGVQQNKDTRTPEELEKGYAEYRAQTAIPEPFWKWKDRTWDRETTVMYDPNWNRQRTPTERITKKLNNFVRDMEKNMAKHYGDQTKGLGFWSHVAGTPQNAEMEANPTVPYEVDISQILKDDEAQLALLTINQKRSQLGLQPFTPGRFYEVFKNDPQGLLAAMMGGPKNKAYQRAGGQSKYNHPVWGEQFDVTPAEEEPATGEEEAVPAEIPEKAAARAARAGATGSAATAQPAGAGTGAGAGATAGGGTSAANGGVSAMSYGADAWQNSPAMKFLTGQMTSAEFNKLASQPTHVPGLGVDLPAPNQINPGIIADMAQNPDTLALINAMFTGGNRNLLAEAAMMGYFTPTGQATPSTAIRT